MCLTLVGQTPMVATAPYSGPARNVNLVAKVEALETRRSAKDRPARTHDRTRLGGRRLKPGGYGIDPPPVIMGNRAVRRLVRCMGLQFICVVDLQCGSPERRDLSPRLGGPDRSWSITHLTEIFSRAFWIGSPKAFEEGLPPLLSPTNMPNLDNPESPRTRHHRRDRRGAWPGRYDIAFRRLFQHRHRARVSRIYLRRMGRKTRSSRCDAMGQHACLTANAGPRKISGNGRGSFPELAKGQEFDDLVRVFPM